MASSQPSGGSSTSGLLVYNRRFIYPKNAIYIGRPGMWGNPYTHSKFVLEKNSDMILVHDRQTAVMAYEDYLLENDRLMGRLRLLVDRPLVCWCSPKEGLDAYARGGYYCHGQPILRAVAALLAA